MVRVCFVCLGNICRSPTAEGIMLKLVADAGLQQRIEVDSAGTGAYHVGEQADLRSRAEARARGVELTSIARKFVAADLHRFQYVIAMDRQNLSDLNSLCRTREERSRLHLLRNFGPDQGADANADVPDPYYGSGDGFARVFNICLASCEGLMSYLAKTHGF